MKVKTMKKLLVVMTTVGLTLVATADKVLGSNEDADAVARREHEEKRRALLTIQNELKQQREERYRCGDDRDVDAKHVHLKSVLGVNEALLADTNRFAIVDGRDSRQTIQLDKPFGGFREATIHLDSELDRLINRRRNGAADCKPHRLHSISLRRRLSDTANDKGFLSEWQASCDFVANVLGVDAPKVQLPDIKNMSGGRGLLGFRCASRVSFNVANDQSIEVMLQEPVYVMRDGKFCVASPGLIIIEFKQRRNILASRKNSSDEDKVQTAEASTKKEIDFGPDCADKLARAIRDNTEKREPGRKATANCPESGKTNQALKTKVDDKTASVRGQIREIEEALVLYSMKHGGKYPDSLEPLTRRIGDEEAFLPNGVLDAWGNAIKLELRGKKRPLVTSAGPDGKFGTEDDLSNIVRDL